MQISKSEYMMFLKHPAWLWYKKHDKKKLPEIDAGTQALFDAGAAFEQYAERRFPDGVKLGFNNYQQYLSLPERTKKALASGAKTIFQGRFEANGLTCICDIVTVSDNKTLDIYEIKSSTRPKQEHEYDLAFQVAVLEAAGLKVRDIYIVHVNRDYVRSGDIDIKKLTKIVDVTDKVKPRLPETLSAIDQAFEVVELATPPDISPRHAKIGGFSDWLDIYKQLVGGVEADSIYNLYWPGPETIGQLEDAGISRITDIPEDFPLSKQQQLRQVKAAKAGSSQVKAEKINEFLVKLKFPLYFLDYETLSDAVPAFDGLRPYDQLPFQYSLHVLDSPSGELKHYEYLHTNRSTPVPPLVEQLRQEVGDTGTVLVWWDQFEKSCNDLMAKLYPEGRELLEDINNRVVDLMLPFAYGWYTDAAFFGSASIKNILPVLVPELSYKGLAIQEGGSAQRLWMDTVLRDKPAPDPDQLFADLKKYCRLDTLAMVEIFKHLKKLPAKEATKSEQLKFL